MIFKSCVFSARFHFLATIWTQILRFLFHHLNIYSALPVLQNSSCVFAHRGIIQSSPAADRDALVAASQKAVSRDLGMNSETDTNMVNKADPRSPSPQGKRASPLTVRETGSHGPPKPPRLTPSPSPSISPLLKRRKAEVGRTSPALKVSIPTILVEDEPMETECGADTNHGGTKTRRKDGRVHKSQKGRSVQPRSPEQGRTYLMLIGRSMRLLGKNLKPERGACFPL